MAKHLRFTSCVFALTLLCSLSMMGAEEVSTIERRFAIQYPDGLERYVVRWSAIADFNTQESGGPAEPLRGKFTDDRQCHWTSNGRIERRVFLVRRGAALTEDPQKFRVYNTDFANNGASFSVTNLRPENCNDARERRESDFNNTRNHLRAALPNAAAADLPIVGGEYVGPQGQVITAQPDLDKLCYAGRWSENVPNAFKWDLRITGGKLSAKRNDGFATGTFTRTASGWAGSVRWGNGDTWENVMLDEASPTCDEIRTNQIWYFKR